MAGDIRVGSIDDVVALENSCNSFADGLRDAVERFVSATAELESSWRDEEFKTVQELADDITDACRSAETVVGEILMPFVQRKRIVLDQRPV